VLRSLAAAPGRPGGESVSPALAGRLDPAPYGHPPLTLALLGDRTETVKMLAAF